MSEDCYFFIDPTIPEEMRTMSILCVECHDQYLPDTGWFYRGSVEGYGPFEYQCCKCGKFIYEPDDEPLEEDDED